MLRKWYVVVIVGAIALGFSAFPSFAARNIRQNHTFTRHVQHHHAIYRHGPQAVLHMYATDENSRWQLTRNAPKGLLRYWLWGETFNFTFQGIRLTPETEYTLIYAVDSTSAGDIVLGMGWTDRRGRIYFEDSVDVCSMPAEYDAAYPYGARILLVPSEPSTENDPGVSLEGSYLIRFFDTNGCDAPVVEDETIDEFPEGGWQPETPTDEFPELPESEVGSEQPSDEPTDVPDENVLF